MGHGAGGVGLIFLSLFRGVIKHILRHRDRIRLTPPEEICRFIESLPGSIIPSGAEL